MEDKDVMILSNKFRQIQYDYCLLCEFERAFITNTFVQVQLKVISSEPEIVDKNSYMFNDGSRDNVCFIKFDSFDDFIEKEYIDANLDDQLDYIEDYLTGKIVVVKPYYYYNSSRNSFYKNGTVYAVVDNDVQSNDLTTIPVITSNTFDSFLKGDAFTFIKKWSKDLLGTPKYVYFEKRIYEVKLEIASDSNDSVWKCIKESEMPQLGKSKIQLNVDEDDTIDYSSGLGYVFCDLYTLRNAKEVQVEVVAEQVEEEESAPEAREKKKIADKLNEFYDFTSNVGLYYQRDDIYNFYTCVKCSQLVILAGMSGTGKTKLPEEFAKFFNMSEENSTLLFVPVSPSFTEPSDILGFLNPNNGLYTSSETCLVEFLKHAEDHSNKMHMIIFDEMNLAQIEFWFAPFISILERDVKDRVLHLYSESQYCINKEKYPATINIGNNVIFIGTINLDETTKNVSDRLLDRSYVINLKKGQFIDYQAQQQKFVSNTATKQDTDSTKDFYEYLSGETQNNFSYINTFNIRQLEFFDKLHSLLNTIEPQKGVSFRSVKNIAIYMKNKPDNEALGFSNGMAFDYAVRQTIMKKINGDIESIGPVLGTINEDNNIVNSKLIELFDQYSDISSFDNCKIEIRDKIIELKKYGYAR